jgi:hypothetical protein
MVIFSLLFSPILFHSIFCTFSSYFFSLFYFSPKIFLFPLRFSFWSSFFFVCSFLFIFVIRLLYLYPFHFFFFLLIFLYSPIFCTFLILSSLLFFHLIPYSLVAWEKGLKCSHYPTFPLIHQLSLCSLNYYFLYFFFDFFIFFLIWKFINLQTIRK